MGIRVNLDRLMLEKRISLTELAAICRELECQPGDILEYIEEEETDEST